MSVTVAGAGAPLLPPLQAATPSVKAMMTRSRSMGPILPVGPGQPRVSRSRDAHHPARAGWGAAAGVNRTDRRQTATGFRVTPRRTATLTPRGLCHPLNPMTRKTILVTGGAGYIGSHVVRQLGEGGESVVVLDDLSTGFRQAVLHGELVVGNTGDSAVLTKLFGQHEIDTVMHFAAHTVVPESVANPLKYYGNNTCAS